MTKHGTKRIAALRCRPQPSGSDGSARTTGADRGAGTRFWSPGSVRLRFGAGAGRHGSAFERHPEPIELLDDVIGGVLAACSPRCAPVPHSTAVDLMSSCWIDSDAWNRVRESFAHALMGRCCMNTGCGGSGRSGVGL